MTESIEERILLKRENSWSEEKIEYYSFFNNWILVLYLCNFAKEDKKNPL